MRLTEHDVLFRRHTVRLAWNLVLEAAAVVVRARFIANDLVSDELPGGRRRVQAELVDRTVLRHGRHGNERSSDEKSKSTHGNFPLFTVSNSINILHNTHICQ